MLEPIASGVTTDLMQAEEFKKYPSCTGAYL